MAAIVVTEMELRRQLIEDNAVDVVVAVGPNMFYTVTLPCTLWFFDKGKAKGPRGEQTLFIDARHIFRQVDRAHRDFTDAQIEGLANIARLWRGEQPEYYFGSTDWMREHFPGFKYRDVPGLCRVATRAEIAAQGWSLAPGRYVGVAAGAADDEDFRERLESLHEELEVLNIEATRLQGVIAQNLAEVLG